MPDSEADWSKLKDRLQSIDPYEFEKFVGALWEQLGYDVTIKPASRDRGIDIVARKSDPFSRKQLLQTKRYGEKNTIGSQEIRNYRTLYDQENDVDTVAIVTTGKFTQDALKLSEDLDVKTVDGNQLCKLIQKYAPALAKPYLKSGDKDKKQDEGAKYEHLLSRKSSEENNSKTETEESEAPSNEERSKSSNVDEDTSSDEQLNKSRADIIDRYSEIAEGYDDTV